MRGNLDKLMQSEKKEIKEFMVKLTGDSYDSQLNLLNQLLQNLEKEYLEESLTKISAKFSVLIGRNL